jgi:protein phosphatase
MTAGSPPADPERIAAPMTDAQPAVRIGVTVPGLVVLVGAAGAGKSTLAARLFAPAEIVSSDDVRGWLTGDPADQRATRLAFSVLHREVRRRLAAGGLAVVDATNVQGSARSALLRIARVAGAHATAIVVRTSPAEVHARNGARIGRVVPPDVVDRHLAALDALGPDPASIVARLVAEGFDAVHVLGGDEPAITLERAAPRS